MAATLAGDDTLVGMTNAASAVIVVVEDDFLIRACAVDILTAEGFTALEAGHAEEALGILRSQGAGIHLVFTDVNMPGSMDGVALAHHVRATWPHVAILVTSSKSPAQLPDGSRFVAKPYAPDEMLMHIRELVEA